MSPVGEGVVSLTKFYSVHGLVSQLAGVTPGMNLEQVRGVLGAAHTHRELADDLVLYSDDVVIDDPLLQACRGESASARVLVWVSLVMADHRIATIVETFLTGSNGKLIPGHFDTDELERALQTVLPGMPTRKAATNILSYLRDSDVVVPVNRRGTIVGISHANSMAPHVRDAVRYIMFRLQHLQIPYLLEDDDAEVALRVEANHWLNLTPSEFRSAYDDTRPDDVPEPPPPPTPPEPVPTPPVTSEVAVEAHNTESYEVSGQTTRTAVRREQALVLSYKAWMEERDSRISRLRFRPPGTPAHLFNDVYDSTRNHLIEGKARADRPSMRMAVGQLMDYRRYAPAGARLAVLTDQRPHHDLEALLTSLDIACIWRDGEVFVDNADGAFV